MYFSMAKIEAREGEVVNPRPKRVSIINRKLTEGAKLKEYPHIEYKKVLWLFVCSLFFEVSSSTSPF